MSSSIARVLSFKPGTFSGCPAYCDSWCSSANADGMVHCLFDFHFKEMGAAVFEIRFSLLHGIIAFVRQGPSASVSFDLGKEMLNRITLELEADGVKFVKLSPLTLFLALRDTMRECSQILTQQDAMYFGNWKTLCLCLHCHMCQSPDARYQQSFPSSGIWKTPNQSVKLCLDNPVKLTQADLEYLAVQTPYIFMGSARYGNKRPTVPLVKQVATFMAWWRRQLPKREDWKAELNELLAFHLLLDTSHATLEALIASILSNRAQMDHDHFSTPRPRSHIWPSGHMQDIIFSSEVANWAPVPAWLKSAGPVPPSFRVDDLEPPAPPGTATSAAQRVPVRPSLLRGAGAGDSAAEAWSPRRDGPFSQARMDGPTLSAHNVLGGWSWPEFLPSLKGAPQPAGDAAAGTGPRGRSRRVVAPDEGMVYSPFLVRDQRDFLLSVDNAAAERLHRWPERREQGGGGERGREGGRDGRTDLGEGGTANGWKGRGPLRTVAAHSSGRAAALSSVCPGHGYFRRAPCQIQVGPPWLSGCRPTPLQGRTSESRLGNIRDKRFSAWEGPSLSPPLRPFPLSTPHPFLSPST
jgi:hypothetical protein